MRAIKSGRSLGRGESVSGIIIELTTAEKVSNKHCAEGKYV